MSLPPDLDFSKNRSASPERMNRAMEYLLAQIRLALALRPDLESALAEIEAVGLQRLTEGVTPLVLEASSANDSLQAILAAWTTEGALQAIQDAIQASQDAAIAAVVAASNARCVAIETRLAALELRADRAEGALWTDGEG